MIEKNNNNLVYGLKFLLRKFLQWKRNDIYGIYVFIFIFIFI